MCDEVIKFLAPKNNGVYLDATFGQGGYSKNILEKTNCQVIGIDRDEESKKFAHILKKKFKDRFFFKNERFSNLDIGIKHFKKSLIDGATFDLGLSNTQLNSAERGFSFKRNGPLDMRMGSQIDSYLTAELIINEFSENELTEIFFKYGEERNSKRISHEIVKSRNLKRIKSTKELSQIIDKVTFQKNLKINNSTRVFQALRIFINKELDELETGLRKCLQLLKKKSRIVVVSFHSLEDRIVKKIFRENSGYFIENYKHLPQKENEKVKPIIKIITKKMIRPSLLEVKLNPRSRSAKLRAAEKL